MQFGDNINWVGMMRFSSGIEICLHNNEKLVRLIDGFAVAKYVICVDCLFFNSDRNDTFLA